MKEKNIRHGVGNIYQIKSSEKHVDGIICMLVSTGVCSDNVFFITLLDGTPVDTGEEGNANDIHNLTESEWVNVTGDPKSFDYISKSLVSLQIKGMKIEGDDFKRYKIQRKKNGEVDLEKCVE